MKLFNRSAIVQLSLCVLVLSACGVGNRKDAGSTTAVSGESATSASSTTASDSATAVSNFANTLVLPSGMARASGVDIVNKIITLFPKAILTTSSGTTQFYLDSPILQRTLRSAASGDFINPEESYADLNQVDARYSTPALATAAVANFNSSFYFQSLSGLNGIDRTTGPLALLQTRVIFENLCAGSNLESPQSILFKEDQSLLMSGETFPTDPATRVAFIVARRAWNFPYDAGSTEVQILKDLYNSSVAADKKVNLCLASLLSDQFWQGNPGQTDVLNRVAVSLSGARPSFAELESYQNGRLQLSDYIKKLQTSQNYLMTVLRWHGSQLGLRSFGIFNDSEHVNTIKPEISGLSDLFFSYLPSNFGAPTTAASVNEVPIMSSNPSGNQGMGSMDGCAMSVAPSKNWSNSIYGVAGESAPQTAASFDPRTTGLFWEQFNPVTQKFEVLAGWVLKPFLSQYQNALKLSVTDFNALHLCQPYATDPRWYKCNGLVTLANGSKKQIRLSDLIQPGLPLASDNSLIGTPIEASDVESPKNLAKGLYKPFNSAISSVQNSTLTRRVVRYSPGTVQNPTGRNDQYSETSGYYSNRKVLACNSLVRFLGTCAYVPRTAKQALNPLRYFDFSRLVPATASAPAIPSTSSATTWNAETLLPSRWVDSGHGQNPMVHTFAHPEALNSFRCGKIDLDSLTASNFNLDISVPWGYEPLPDYNTGMSGDQVPASWLATGQSVPDQSQLNTLLNRAWNSGSAAGYESNQERLADALQREPYDLIKDIVENNLDYGLMTTASYSFMTKPLELFYRTRGEPMSVWPKGYVPPNPNDASSLSKANRVEFSNLGSYPLRVQNYLTNKGVLNAATLVNVERPAAGVLQMPGVLQPMDPGSVRSLSSRVFLRFLCGQPDIYDPVADGTQDAQLAAFARMPATASGSGQAFIQSFVDTHLKNKADCMSCHQNLDPLGMGLFKFYGGNLAFKQGIGSISTNSELHRPVNTPALPFGTSADLNLKGNGVFLGKSVSGWGDVGATLAKSRMFYACSVQTAFQNMYGRMPTHVEAQKAYREVIDRFYSSHNYNQMVIDLAEIQQHLGGE